MEPPSPAPEPRLATLDEILPLRHDVLRPGKPAESAAFEGDDRPTTRHFGLFRNPEDRPLACLTLMHAPLEGVPAWQLRGMAVDRNLQGRGLGGRLLAFAVDWVRAQHGDNPRIPNLLWCNARAAAVPFYARNHWTLCSEPFDIPGIGPHYRMRRSTTPLS